MAHITTTFIQTNGVQMYTVPAGTTALTISMCGAQGGYFRGNPGGNGAGVNATLVVTPGQQFNIYVGGSGAQNGLTGGWNGGGAGTTVGGGGSASGGGATDIRTSTTLDSRVIVAGGGGGASLYCNAVGGAAGKVGSAGATCSTTSCTSGGQGATQSAGGSSGVTGGTYLFCILHCLLFLLKYNLFHDSYILCTIN